jgi:hypothetical protein
LLPSSINESFIGLNLSSISESIQLLVHLLEGFISGVDLSMNFILLVK